MYSVFRACLVAAIMGIAATACWAADVKVPKDHVELSWYFFGSGPQKNQAAVEEKVNEYLKDKINASVKFYNLDWDTFIQRTNLMSAADEAYDIIFTAVWLEYTTGLEKNRWLDMNESGMLDKYAPDIKGILGNDFIKGGQVGEHQYGLPVNKEKATSFGLLFRKDLVEKYKFDIDSIKKMEDLEPMFKVIKEKEQGVIPWAFRSEGASYDLRNLFEVVTEDELVPGAVRADTKGYLVVNQFEQPEYINAYKLAYKWRQLGYIDKDALAKKGSQKERSQQGEFFCQGSALKPGKDAEMSNDKFKYVQKEMTKAYIGNSQTNGSMQSISRTSKNPERALMLLNLMYTDKTLYNLVVYGIEGVNYTRISDNVVDPIQDSGYDVSNWQWEFGNQFLAYLKKNENPNKWKLFDDFNKHAIPAKTLGFKYANAGNFVNEYTACKNALQEYCDAMGAGVTDPAKGIPELTKKLKAAGMDRYLRDIQVELDKWAAGKK